MLFLGTKSDAFRIHSETSEGHLCSSLLLKRSVQLILPPSLATMFPKDGVGTSITTSFSIVLGLVLHQALAQQTTSFNNIDCCAVKKVEGKQSPLISKTNVNQVLQVLPGHIILLMLTNLFLTHASKSHNCFIGVLFLSSEQDWLSR